MRYRRFDSASWLAVMTLGLAMAAITAIFSVLYSVLLAPLPYRDAGRIVQLNSTREGKPGLADFSLAEFDDWRASTRTLDDVAAYGVNEFSVTQAGQNAEAISAAAVSGDFFSLLGTAPIRGRFVSGDLSTPDVVVSERFWRTRLGADPGIVGRTINLSGRSYSVIGVAPATFRIPARLRCGSRWPRPEKRRHLNGACGDSGRLPCWPDSSRVLQLRRPGRTQKRSH